MILLNVDDEINPFLRPQSSCQDFVFVASLTDADWYYKACPVEFWLSFKCKSCWHDIATHSKVKLNIISFCIH